MLWEFGVEPFLLLPAVLDLRPLARWTYLVSLPVGAGIALQGLVTQIHIAGFCCRVSGKTEN